MSHKIDLHDLTRGGSTSLTAQLVARIRSAIDAGTLAPGEKLPTTRALAQSAAINHLTAVRVYRRLAELGYVTSAVGRGTFVRTVPPAGAQRDSVEWQTAVLPELRPAYANELMVATFRIPSDPDLISLGTGAPAAEAYPVDELARMTADIYADLGGHALSYLDPEGLDPLREEIAERGRIHGFATEADEIVVTAGARQAIDLVCRTILGPGDVVVCESPTFIGILASLQATGARVIGLPVDEHGLDVDALERVLARHEVKLVAVQPLSHNPTGRDLSPARAQRLLELARRRSFFVLEDGVYATVRFDGVQRPRLRSRAPDHVLYVDALSKTIGGGLRLGWVAARGPVRQRLAELKLGCDTHTSSLVQHLGHRWLASGRHEVLLETTNPLYAERCAALTGALRERMGDEARWREPVGGHHLWVTLRRPLDQRLLLSEALRHGVTFTPGGATLAERSPQTSMRLSFSLHGPEQLDEGVRRLAAAVRAVRRVDRASGVMALS